MPDEEEINKVKIINKTRSTMIKSDGGMPPTSLAE